MITYCFSLSRITGCRFRKRLSLLFSDEPFTYASENLMLRLSLSKTYQPPEFAQRCQINIDFDLNECTIVLMKVQTLLSSLFRATLI